MSLRHNSLAAGDVVCVVCIAGRTFSLGECTDGTGTVFATGRLLVQINTT